MSRPDEGLIHAWLDGELDAAEAARVERLVQGDPEWAAAVAEARGFIAGSDRILGALDDVPAKVIPAAPKADAGGSQRGGVAPAGNGSGGALPNARGARTSHWWALRAAAVLVVVAGAAVVMQRRPEPTMETGHPPAGLPPLPTAGVADQSTAPPAQLSAPGAAAATVPKDFAAAAKLKEAGAAPSAESQRAAAAPVVANELARDEPKREPAASGAPAAKSAPVASAVQTPAVAGAAVEGGRARQAQFRADAAKTVGAVAVPTHVECYRAIGGSDTLRVQRLTDSTVVDARLQTGVDATGVRMSNMARTMRVRGDTLFTGPGPSAAAALKVTCPQP